MNAGDTYKAGFEYQGHFEKKGALAMWSKKYVTLTGLKFCVADNETAAPSQSFEIVQVIQAENADPTQLTIKGASDTVNLRGERQQVDAWYELGRTALEFAGKARPRNPGLPPVDPRFGLKFADIPVEYRHRFASLESAVLYWFQPVRKYGAPNRITGKFSTEDRVVLIGDKAIYVTKPDSEVTRCIKIAMIKAIYTNATSKQGDEDTFAVVKMEAPEYDLYFSAQNGMDEFGNVLRAIYRSLTKGRELPVVNASGPTDSKIDLQLVRPSGFSMAMVVPTTKSGLKKALDEFANKHGIRLTTTGSAEVAKKSAGGAKGAAGGAAAAQKTTAASQQQDALTRFMLSIGLPQTLKMLKKQHVDFDVLRVMEADDYSNFGISAADAKVIRAHIEDEAFLAKIDAGESNVKSATAKPAERGGGFDDLDIDLDGPAPAPSQQAANFDDFEIDDIEVAQGSVSNFSKNIVLTDSDDDLDLPPPKPKAAPQAVDIDDI